MKTVILFTLLACAFASPLPYTESEELERETMKLIFDTLREMVKGGDLENELVIPEQEQETVLFFLDRMYDIAVVSIDRTLSYEQRNKNQFLSILDLVEEVAKANKGKETLADRREKKALLAKVEKYRVILKEQSDDTYVDKEKFKPILEQLFVLVSSRGEKNEGYKEFLLEMKSFLEELIDI